MSFAEELDTALIEDILQRHRGSGSIAGEAVASQRVVVVYRRLPVARRSPTQEGFRSDEVELREADDLEVIHRRSVRSAILTHVLRGVVGLRYATCLRALADELCADVIGAGRLHPRDEVVSSTELRVHPRVGIAPEAIEPCVGLLRGEHLKEGLRRPLLAPDRGIVCYAVERVGAGGDDFAGVLVGVLPITEVEVGTSQEACSSPVVDSARVERLILAQPFEGLRQVGDDLRIGLTERRTLEAVANGMYGGVQGNTRIGRIQVHARGGDMAKETCQLQVCQASQCVELCYLIIELRLLG